VLSAVDAATRVIVNQHTARERNVADTPTPVHASVMLTIQHERGSLSLTPDHVLLLDGTWAAARHAVAGSVVEVGGAACEVIAVSPSLGVPVNPLTASGTILVGARGSEPLLASVYPEWIAKYMLAAASGALAPLPLTRLAALLLPATTQAFYDIIIEPLFPASGPSFRTALERIPDRVLPAASAAADAAFLAFLAGYTLAAAPITLAVAMAALVVYARKPPSALPKESRAVA